MNTTEPRDFDSNLELYGVTAFPEDKIEKIATIGKGKAGFLLVKNDIRIFRQLRNSLQVSLPGSTLWRRCSQGNFGWGHARGNLISTHYSEFIDDVGQTRFSL